MFRNIILVATCGSSQRRVDRQWEGGFRSGRGNVRVQEASGRLNISAGKFRVMGKGDADLDGRPGDGWKAKEMAGVRDVHKKGNKVLFIDWSFS